MPRSQQVNTFRVLLAMGAAVLIASTLCIPIAYSCLVLHSDSGRATLAGEGPGWMLFFTSIVWFFISLPAFVEVYRRFIVRPGDNRFVSPLFLVMLSPLIAGTLSNLSLGVFCGIFRGGPPGQFARDLLYGVIPYGTIFGLFVYLVGAVITPWLSKRGSVGFGTTALWIVAPLA